MQLPLFCTLISTVLLFVSNTAVSQIENSNSDVHADKIIIRKTADFTITGDGFDKNWERTNWIVLNEESDNKSVYSAKAKVLYSQKGIYFLFSCQDDHLTATKTKNYTDLWNEDVVEVFLWPDQTKFHYFEYELSPLNYELSLLIGRGENGYSSWIPFTEIEPSDGTIHKVKIKKNENSQGNQNEITGWTSEFFISFKILQLLNSVPPVSGTTWRANMYRIDYDDGYEAKWSWQDSGGNFHTLDRFGIFEFE